MKKMVLAALMVYLAFGLAVGMDGHSHQATIDDGPGPMSTPIKIAVEKGGEPMSVHSETAALYDEGPGPMTVTKA